MKKYKFLLLDADGTLFDFKRSEREALTEALSLHGIRATSELVTLYSGINDRLWKEFERGKIDKADIRTLRFARLSEQGGLEFDVEKMSIDYTAQLSEKRHLIKGALEACAVLSRHAKLYIITNGIHAVQMSRIKQSPIDRYITDIFVSEKIGFAKPNIAYFYYVFDHVEGANRENSLVVGDSLTSDIAGGITAGIDVCWINPDGGKAPECMAIQYILPDISCLPALIIK